MLPLAHTASIHAAPLHTHTQGLLATLVLKNRADLLGWLLGLFFPQEDLLEVRGMPLGRGCGGSGGVEGQWGRGQWRSGGAVGAGQWRSGGGSGTGRDAGNGGAEAEVEAGS